MKLKTLLLSLFLAVPALAGGVAVADACFCGDACPCGADCDCP